MKCQTQSRIRYTLYSIRYTVYPVFRVLFLIQGDRTWSFLQETGPVDRALEDQVRSAQRFYRSTITGPYSVILKMEKIKPDDSSVMNFQKKC